MYSLNCNTGGYCSKNNNELYCWCYIIGRGSTGASKKSRLGTLLFRTVIILCGCVLSGMMIVKSHANRTKIQERERERKRLRD